MNHAFIFPLIYSDSDMIRDKGTNQLANMKAVNHCKKKKRERENKFPFSSGE